MCDERVWVFNLKLSILFTFKTSVLGDEEKYECRVLDNLHFCIIIYILRGIEKLKYEK